MLSKNTEYVLEVALANTKLADEISARLLSVEPANAGAASDALAILDKSLNKQIEEYLIVALAHRPSGKEIAQKINSLIDVLEAIADGDEVAAEAAQFQGQVAGMTTDVTIDADVAGAAGNITLTADSVTDIDDLIAAHNAGAPANEQVTLSDGDGTQIPTEDIVLSGGSDESDANTAVAKAAFGSERLSESAYERLVVALASRPAAKEFREAFDAMVEAFED
jgi:hypothetical protein